MTDFNELCTRLYNIPRSITGKGIRDSLAIISEYMPLEIHEVKSGTKVFDWTVPKEWELISGELKDDKGNVLISSKDNIMHVLNFSESFEGRVSAEELFKDHIWTLPNLPDAIPYVTSYYKERWGFCLSHRQRQTLTADNYYVDIKCRKYDGALTYGRAFLPGSSNNKIVLTSYLCHPNMLNNELSGPMALIYLYNKLKEDNDRYYSYEFIINPETIGSISLLSTQGHKFTDNIEFGMVLTCLASKKGEDTPLSFKLSRQDLIKQLSSKLDNNAADNYTIDKYLRYIASSGDFGTIKLRDFTPNSGSDERQFCSALVNLPFVQASRTVYATYDEYHTSLDNPDLFSLESIEQSAAVLYDIIKTYDLSVHKVQTTTYGEPQLGKRDLYPTINTPLILQSSKDGVSDNRVTLDNILKLLNYADGSFTLMDLSLMTGMSLKEVIDYYKLLKSKGVFKDL